MLPDADRGPRPGTLAASDGRPPNRNGSCDGRVGDPRADSSVCMRAHGPRKRFHLDPARSLAREPPCALLGRTYPLRD